MLITEQEIPLILIIFLGSLGSVFLLMYQNFLCPKKSTHTIQKVYVGASVFGIFLSILCVVCSNKFLNGVNWILSGVLISYFLVSFFLPGEYSRGMLTWSDFFLMLLGLSCQVLRLYASLLLTYDRARNKPLCQTKPINSCGLACNSIDAANQPNGVVPGSVA